MATATQPGAAVRRGARPLHVAEAMLALGAFAALLSVEGLRAVAFAVLRAAAAGASSAVRLAAVDGAATAWSAAATLAKVSLVAAPAVRAATLTSRHRLSWAPLYGVFFVLGLPMLFPAISTPLMWALLAAASALAWIAARRPALRALALSPLAMAYEPLLGHGPLADLAWTRGALEARCAQNDGVRPRGFRPSLAAPRYYAITPFGADRLLVTGDGAAGSWWLRREPDAGDAARTERTAAAAADGAAPPFALAERSALSGNYWQGCRREGSVWLTKRGQLVEVRRDGDAERVRVVPLPDPEGAGIELDLAEPVCGPRSVMASELLRGGLRELLLDAGPEERAAVDRHVLGGLNLQLARRSDGMLVGIDTTRLFVYDPAARSIVEEHAAGISAFGVDLCGDGGAVAVADLAGRLRVFARTPAGRYAFAEGIDLPAPRRVVFSPDCARLAVTSGDDHTVSVLRRGPLRVERRYLVGPGLRDLTFLDDRTLAVADACMATFFRVDREGGPFGLAH